MLDKWNIALQPAGHSIWEQYPPQNFVCAQLLELVQSQAISKFLAHSGSSQDVRGAILVSVVPLRVPWGEANHTSFGS